MESESATDVVFNDYKQLEPKSKSFEHYFVIVIHVAAALVISMLQFNGGISAWMLGFGIVTPTLLVFNGFAYSYFENDSWYREQMVPFMSRLITTTEIETDRYCQYHRRLARLVLIFGWLAILLTQLIWTFGLSQIITPFLYDVSLILISLELVTTVLIFALVLQYFLFIMLFGVILEKILQSRYADIAHLIDIENKWTKENNRRAKNPESVLEDTSSDNQWL